jgi:hypothetical protein
MHMTLMLLAALLSCHCCLCRAPNPTVTPSDIESSTQKIADELAVLGINLQTALKGKVRKRPHCS